MRTPLVFLSAISSLPRSRAHCLATRRVGPGSRHLPYAAVSERQRGIEFSHEGTFVRSGIGSKLRCIAYENFIRARSELLHGLLNKCIEWHCRFCLSAVHQIGSHPWRSQF